MDNTGLYLTYSELLLSMSLAGNNEVVKSDIQLSGKVTSEDGDTFEFTVAGNDPSPKVRDVISQAGKIAEIIDFTSPNKIQISTTGEIVNGPADLLHSDSVPKHHGEDLIQQAMDIIDESTGQYFNKREGIFKIEGNNTQLMHLPVPIISIDELLINSTNTELKEGEDFDFVAFKSRQKPTDHRRNPRIKLNIGRGRENIFSGSLTSRIFVKGTLTQITGAFGFLEPDGRTPSLIKRAVQLLVMRDIKRPIASSLSVEEEVGPVKRLKVDLHEKEFFEPSSNRNNIKSSTSGIEEVDKIISFYRTPLRVSGSVMFRDLRSDDIYRNRQ